MWSCLRTFRGPTTNLMILFDLITRVFWNATQKEILRLILEEKAGLASKTAHCRSLGKIQGAKWSEWRDLKPLSYTTILERNVRDS
jgi:hypothetical protein